MIEITDELVQKVTASLYGDLCQEAESCDGCHYELEEVRYILKTVITILEQEGTNKWRLVYDVEARAYLDAAERVARYEADLEKLDAIRTSISNYPDPCELHPDDDVVTCGWKVAYQDIVDIMKDE